jgi:DNA (cytosine-5)-methyltransferase 1
MKILNLYAGLGGNRKLWGNDHEVTAVEKSHEIASVYKQQYHNDRIVLADAHQYLLNHHFEYDFIWSSPPCQSHSKMVKGSRHRPKSYPDMALYQEIIFLQHFAKCKWVVENVKPYYETLIKPTKTIGRHYFWANFDITDLLEEIHFPNFINTGTVKESENLKEWLGIKYKGNIYYEGNHDPNQVLRNCVHPKMGLHILKAMIQEK